jgi:ferredoxin
VNRLWLNSLKYHYSPIIAFTLSTIYAAAIALSLLYFKFDFFPLFWLIGMVIVRPLYRSGSFWMEASILLLLYLLARGDAGYLNMYTYLPLVSTVLMLTSYKTDSRFFRLCAPLLVITWLMTLYLASSSGPDLYAMNSKTWFILVCAAVGLVIYTLDSARVYPPVSGRSDVILCSNSGNTAHYARRFMEGMRDAGMPAELHRFHYYEDFSPELSGDNLVVAFPVSGWKPPWPLVSYLARKLPPGRGKPAFVLYTSAGGPENAGVVAWMILTLRGYRVAGRCWATYPMNVVTFRPGTKRMWQAIDKLTPTTGSIDEAGQFGREFARGRQTGLPFIFWPFPLFIAGFLLDNRWTNVFLYRNRSWKRRCTRCGLCVSACPSQRLHADEEGYPRAKGTCSLCMLCINICPVNAMQMLFWSEYGQPYVPRWPELVVRKKEYPIDFTF